MRPMPSGTCVRLCVMASDRQQSPPPEWQHWSDWTARLWAARERGDLEACLALREEDTASSDPEVRARALNEERRWHAEHAPKPMTPREHLTEIKEHYLQGKISVEEARFFDGYWRLRMIEERSVPVLAHEWVPLSVRHGGPVKKAAWRLKGWRTGWALRIAPWLGGRS